MITEEQRSILNQAESILAELFQREGLKATNPCEVKQFCTVSIGYFEHEVFAVLFLDNKHHLIKFVKMFRGTIDSASVYPREVAKEALSLNAAAVIFTHNHPSGCTDESRADIAITKKLVDALGLFDIRVLDLVIVSGNDTLSFAERGLL